MTAARSTLLIRYRSSPERVGTPCKGCPWKHRTCADGHELLMSKVAYTKRRCPEALTSESMPLGAGKYPCPVKAATSYRVVPAYASG